MRLIFALSVLISLLAFGPAAAAFTGLTTENFTTATYEDTANTTAVWNLVTNTVHPPLTVCYSAGYPCNADNEDFNVDIGTGSDGPFDVPYYSNFGTVTGSAGNYTITLDTNAHPSFNFTYFNLAAGYTIAGTGPNILWFKVQGNFTNAGVINCSGGNGAAVSSNPAVVASGGAGVCGGGNGGNGGSSPSINGSGGGSSGSPLNTGGAGGTGSLAMSQTPYGGGGGGSYGGSGSGGAGNGTVGGGSAPAGTVTSDAPCGNLGSVGDGPGGGSGGGGGGAYTYPSDGFMSSGAGGGAGGGVIHIAIGGNYTQTSTGQILANGGNGGNGNATLDGGPGGGGGGGTVIVHSGGTVTDNGVISAIQGTAGTTGHGGSAGAGAAGRDWIVQAGPALFLGGWSPNNALMGNIGVVHYKIDPFILQTLGYDSLNTSPIYTLFSQIASLPNASTATLQIAGSNDNFVNDNTGFVPVTNVNALSGKRFFKIKDTIQLVPGGAATAPAAVSNLTAAYGGFQTSSFQFGSACGTFGSPGEFLFDMFLCLSIGLISTGRLRRRKLFRRSKTNPAS